MVMFRIPPFLLLAASLTVLASAAGAQSRDGIESAPLLPPADLPSSPPGSAQPYPPQSYPSQTAPTQPYPPQGYPPQSYPPQSYPPQSYPPQSYPPQSYPPQSYPPQSYPPQGRTYPQQPPPGAPRPGATTPGQLDAPDGGSPVQSSPLPPAGAPPAGAPNQSGPAAAAPPQGDVTVVKPPTEKIVNPTAVFAGLDKITGRITSFEVAMGETVQFGALQITSRACYTRPPTETANTTAFAEVNEITLQGEAKRIFTGWMFASSPGLHGVEHPIYDVWLMDCKATPPDTGRSADQK